MRGDTKFNCFTLGDALSNMRCFGREQVELSRTSLTDGTRHELAFATNGKPAKHRMKSVFQPVGKLKRTIWNWFSNRLENWTPIDEKAQVYAEATPCNRHEQTIDQLWTELFLFISLSTRKATTEDPSSAPLILQKIRSIFWAVDLLCRVQLSRWELDERIKKSKFNH